MDYIILENYYESLKWVEKLKDKIELTFRR